MDVETTAFVEAAEPLVTKFDRPQPPPHRVARPRVMALFPEVPRAVTALVAPAGYGKTTALAWWVSNLEIDTTWLRLDEGDQDPARFGRHLSEAVNQVVGGVLPRPAAAALCADGTVGPAHRVTPLLNYFAGRDRPLVVVFDDFHSASSPDIDEIVDYLIKNAPRTLPLCFTSRSQPELHLTRLRAAGALTELSVLDLGLDVEETREMAGRITGLSVSDDEAAELHRATEGWPVMVALAAHAIATRPDNGGVSQVLEEAGRELHSYVLEEVLAACDVGDIDLVRSTSILDQVTGPLADTVRGESGSGARLARLARSGFPLEQLQGTGPWYRYHRYVAQTLREQLATTASVEQVRELHRRAAAWLEDAGAGDASLDHALTATDYDRAVRLLNHRWLGLVNQGQLLTVRTWLHQLPTDVVEADPALALAVAWTNLMAGDLDAVSPYLAAARDVTAEEPTLPGASSVASGVALVETLYFRVIGRLSEACDRAEVALELEPGPDAAGRARALAYAGICRFWKGQFDHASRLLNHSAGVADRFGHRMARVLALGYLGLIEAEHKSTDGLRAIVADAEAVIDEAGLYLHPVAAPALAASGLLTVGDNRPEEGLAKLEDALAVASIQAEPGLLAYLNVACAKILDDLGRTEEADRRRLVARGLCRRAEDVGFIAARCGGHDGELASPDVALTGREVTVLQLLTSSLTLPEIASELFVSHNTVKTHVRSLYRKLGVSKREDAVRVAATLGVP